MKRGQARKSQNKFVVMEPTGIAKGYRALPGPMHLGLTIGPLCPIFCTKL